ncbi:hypothetical protein AGR1A_Cc40221 [Agrobacterium fabacearum CFBP 5771]|nr:hypothetical protein AGR1A_Cc40221 [Agrobacterium fabacearum CFBP 5771]
MTVPTGTDAHSVNTLNDETTPKAPHRASAARAPA